MIKKPFKPYNFIAEDFGELMSHALIVYFKTPNERKRLASFLKREAKLAGHTRWRELRIPPSGDGGWGLQ